MKYVSQGVRGWKHKLQSPRIANSFCLSVTEIWIWDFSLSSPLVPPLTLWVSCFGHTAWASEGPLTRSQAPARPKTPTSKYTYYFTKVHSYLSQKNKKKLKHIYTFFTNQGGEGVCTVPPAKTIARSFPSYISGLDVPNITFSSTWWQVVGTPPSPISRRKLLLHSRGRSRPTRLPNPPFQLHRPLVKPSSKGSRGNSSLSIC